MQSPYMYLCQLQKKIFFSTCILDHFPFSKRERQGKVFKPCRTCMTPIFRGDCTITFYVCNLSICICANFKKKFFFNLYFGPLSFFKKGKTRISLQTLPNMMTPI